VSDISKLLALCGRLSPAVKQGEWLALLQKLNFSEGFSKAAAGLTLLKTIMGTSLINLSQANCTDLYWHTE